MNQNKLKVSIKPTNIYIIFITLLGAFFRLLSFQYNEIPHRLKVQKFVTAASVIGVIFVSFITFHRVPSHTNYYDSNEFFHYRTGEVEWLATERLLIDVTAHLPTSDSSYPIIGPKASLAYHAKRPIVLVNGIKDPEIIGKLIQQHKIEYIIDIQDRVDFYSGFLNTTSLYWNEEFFLLAIN